MTSSLLASALRHFQNGRSILLQNASVVGPMSNLGNFQSLNGNNTTFGGSVTFVQTRGSRVKTRLTHPRNTWPKRRRERNDQELTADNQAFLNKVVYDKYGPAHFDWRAENTGMPFISPLKQIIYERGEWEPRSIRTGVIGRKIGIHPMWDKDGNRMLTTLVQVTDNHVLKYIPPETVEKNYGPRFKRKDVGLLLVGAESTDPQRFTKEYLNVFDESGVPPKTKTARFMVTPNAKLQPGTPLYATHFKVGQRVEVFGHTVDHGFQGVMKRWGFKGMPASHGVTKSHRRGGNTGGGGEKARVWPGTKLPGHMGNRWRKLLGQHIIRINTKYNVLYIRGHAVMGEVGSFVTICDSFLSCAEEMDKSTLPFPTHYPEESEEPIPEEYYAPNIYNFADPSIVFEDKR
ncbi:unnamed protein product [Orchesella dallaii]|uniref:Large ribosomal subunit protein uL3m n=1 Tax=Orchesella dallaii TaxID=48710 RepID=A0ABP1Q6S8_9HEXA